MTILTIKNQLLTHFMSHDTFDFSRHALELEFDKELAGFREQMVTAACEELEKMGLVKKMLANDSAKEIWVLVQPLAAFQQQVIISPITANMVALTVNHHNEMDEIEGRCDMTKIDEADILRLVQIVGDLEEFMAEVMGGGEEDQDAQNGEAE